MYIAHSENQFGEPQSLAKHLRDVSCIATKFIADSSTNAPMYRSLLYLSALYHDYGKYADDVQERMWGRLLKRVDHSTAGAYAMRAQFPPQLGSSLLVAMASVMSHHTGLIDTVRMADRIARYQTRSESESTLDDRLLSDFSDQYPDIDIPGMIHQCAKVLDNFSNNIPKLYPKGNLREVVQFHMFLRFIFSCLVDADYLDTEKHFHPEKTHARASFVLQEVFSKIEIPNIPQRTNVDALRNLMHAECMAKANYPVGVFRMPIPTGGGKTRTGLDFSLEHAKHHGLSRVIMTIPFTTIIEQTAEAVRQWILSQYVLEHHHLADYESIESTEEDTNVKLLATENWDVPVVITTHVQFFESLFGFMPSTCRKLHNIANSVVIIDEFQQIPVQLHPYILYAMEFWSKEYNVSFVISSATQPKDSFYSQFPDWHVTTLLDDEEGFYDKMVRAHINTERFKDSISIDDFTKECANEHQALVICNHKKEVYAIYDALRDTEGIYVLTTNLYPKHRSRILCEIKERLNNGERCIVISTQLIEAGVDIDFPVVYRELAPLDRIIQACGRANREGCRETGICYVFKLEGVAPLKNEKDAVTVTESILDKCRREHRPVNATSTVQEYYSRWYERAKQDSVETRQEIELHLRNLHQKKLFESMTLIKERDGERTAIVVDEFSREVVEPILERIRETGFVSREARRELSKYAIGVPVRDCGGKADFLEHADMYVLKSGHYDSTCGLI